MNVRATSDALAAHKPAHSACRHYLAQLNFYRQRVWSCHVTGRGGLTFEEALTSEFLSGDGEAPQQVGLPR